MDPAGRWGELGRSQRGVEEHWRQRPSQVEVVREFQARKSHSKGHGGAEKVRGLATDRRGGHRVLGKPSEGLGFDRCEMGSDVIPPGF